jgi:hypothetical protein
MADATTVRVTSPSYQAYEILHVAFTIAPIVAGLDKFFGFLTNWEMYLSPLVTQILGVSARPFMLGIGVIEVIAGLLVAAAPRIGGWVVGLWLCGIVLNLLSVPGYFDIALRDFCLELGAFALARLSVDYSEV